MKTSALALLLGSCFMAHIAMAEDLAIGSELEPSSAAAYRQGGNALELQQEGAFNHAGSYQWGQSNTAIVAQSGHANVAQTTQRGYANEAAILQSGSYLHADITQSGIGHDAEIIQSGYAKEASIDQQGIAGNVRVVQLSSSNTPVTVTQYAKGRMNVQVIQH